MKRLLGLLLLLTSCGDDITYTVENIQDHIDEVGYMLVLKDTIPNAEFEEILFKSSGHIYFSETTGEVLSCEFDQPTNVIKLIYSLDFKKDDGDYRFFACFDKSNLIQLRNYYSNTDKMNSKRLFMIEALLGKFDTLKLEE